ncbi:hypothetical protein [Salinicoccus roseus]|nr:hypothetical protein [Salinicoccus roseus]
MSNVAAMVNGQLLNQSIPVLNHPLYCAGCTPVAETAFSISGW